MITKNKSKSRVVFLLDSSNSWIEKFIKEFKKKANKKFKKKFFFKIEKNLKKIKSNSIIFLLGYTKILSQNFIKKNQETFVIHESKLPYGKGFSPVQWQVLKNRRQIPVVLFKANKKVDNGNIIFTDKFFIKKTDLNDDIRRSQAQTTIKIIDKFLSRYPNIPEKKQTGKNIFFRRRTKLDSQLDLNKSLMSQMNLLRIVDNEKYPAFFTYSNKKFIIKIFKEKK